MRRLAPAALAALLCGCLSLQVGDAPRASVPVPEGAELAAKPAPPPTDKKERASLADALERVERERSSYKIGPADLLEITVYQEKDLDRKVRVSPEGTVGMPLAGTISVAGLGVAEAERALTERLRRFIISPQVSIFITEYGNKQVYVLGEVAKPGSYPLPTEARLSVLEAIILAGGFTQYAAVDKTRVIRKGRGTQAILIDITAITKRGDKSKDVLLEPNDVIYVPESIF
ncbi:MAG: polysaccharide biosynthesis/export family protein [Elusimicrobia bacterium]|nr:polysaccharide biosynthesis/export family protein [Elusimicrobiota bacterium]